MNAGVSPGGDKVARGGLLSDHEARALSARLFRLGDQWEEIAAQLDVAGYGAPAAAERAAIASLAASDTERLQLQSYWTEWARERLAGLVGPINILRGKYPSVSAYRSELIQSLREDVLAGRIVSEGPISSPQMQPTLKRYIERMPDDPASRQVNDDIKQARRQAAAVFQQEHTPEFLTLDREERYQLLIARYRNILEKDGFTLDSHRKKGLSFRKLTSDRRWAFLLVDESRGGLDLGVLSASFALTFPKKAVLPGAVSLTAVATFAPEDLVPRFRASSIFDPSSYAEFCLAADSVASLSGDVYARINRLLEGSS